MTTTPAWFILEIADGWPSVRGPYATHEERRKAALDFVGCGRIVFEIDGHHGDSRGVEVYVKRVPTESQS